MASSRQERAMALAIDSIAAGGFDSGIIVCTYTHEKTIEVKALQVGVNKDHLRVLHNALIDGVEMLEKMIGDDDTSSFDTKGN